MFKNSLPPIRKHGCFYQACMLTQCSTPCSAEFSLWEDGLERVYYFILYSFLKPQWKAWKSVAG